MIPDILKNIKFFLETNIFHLNSENDDGRINSSNSEKIILDILSKEYKEIIYIPKVRHWYDFLIKDIKCGNLPVNIKITTTNTADNIGNLAPCVYAYTDHPMRLKKTYNNGQLSKVLLEKIKTKSYNNDTDKDYWFLVINNKNNTIIINSILGLKKLVANINNLPFQVRWKDNTEYSFENIEKSVSMFIKTLQKPKPSWKEEFISEIRKINK